MYKGTTPTFTLTLPADIDLGNATNVYVTFSTPPCSTASGSRITVTKTGTDLDIDANVINVYLDQEETLRFTGNRVLLQANWTYREGSVSKRACSEIVTLVFEDNLADSILQ